MTDKPQTIADILDAAADLIEPQGAWTQGVLARNERGQQVAIYSKNASCFCMGGALALSGTRESILVPSPMLRALGFGTIFAMMAWNDRCGRTQAEVVAKLREAAAVIRAEG